MAVTSSTLANPVRLSGLRKAFGLVDLTDLVRSFPSMYQLLPIYPCVTAGDGAPAYITDVATRISG